MKNPTINKFFMVAVLFTALFFFSACGSSGDGSEADDSNEPTLAEVAANLPKPGSVNVGSSTTNSGNSNSGANVGTSNAAPPSNSNSNISHSMRRFLWKPESESNGNLVVLLDPTGVRVEVFGSISETLRDFGPSNERGTTARGSFPGCNYGSGIQLRFYARNGQQLGFVDGRATVRVPNGCSRVEFNL